MILDWAPKGQYYQTLDVFTYTTAASSVVVQPPPPPAATGGAGGFIDFLAWRPNQIVSEKVRLQIELRKKKLQLKKVEAKIKKEEPKVFQPEPPQGILANLGSLREQRAELRKDIEIVAVNLAAAKDFLRSLQFDDDDEDDLEVLFL